MKKKFLSILPIGIAAVILVMIGDLFATLSLGNFAWIAFVLWNFTSKKTDDSSLKNLILRIVIGLPIGLLLSLAMIHIPAFLNNNYLIKYLVVFVCNGIAVLFPNQLIPSIFFGIGLTFSGLGVGIMPNSLNNILIILVVTISFSILGIIAAWSSEKIQNMNK